MRIIKTTLPKDSLLYATHKEYDYVDSYRRGGIENKCTSVDLGKAFFSCSPKWVEKVFYLRNKIVSLFGLKTSGNHVDRAKQLENFKCEPGEQMGLFKVFETTKNEVIFGEDDKHLNFRVSLFVQPEVEVSAAKNKEVTISTIVEFNNWFGKLYFLPVRPFHKLIVPSMLKGMIKELEKNS